MADFFLSVPGLLATAGVGVLILLRSGGGSRPRPARGEDRTTRAVQIAISAVILGAGLWVILSGRYPTDSERWASGAIGTVMGYWLKP
jgi:hypothetical protein